MPASNEKSPDQGGPEPSLPHLALGVAAFVAVVLAGWCWLR
jgi:hypothetical protein